MRRLWRRVLTVIYPLAFALAPILALYANNAATFRLGVVVVPLVYAAAATLAVLVLAARRLRDLERGAIVTSYFVILFFSHGHFQRFTVGLGAPPWLAGWLLVGLGSAFAAAGYFGVSRARNLRLLDRLLRVAAFLMLALPLTHVGALELAVRTRARAALDSLSVRPIGSEPRVESLPDIYYIVLDGYGRHDVLMEQYGYDNAPFRAALEERGFRIAHRSHANYAHATLSTASVLNMDLVLPDPSVSPRRVVSTLKWLGYTTVTFENATQAFDIAAPDIHFQRDALDPFYVGVLQMTPIAVFVPVGRGRTDGAFDPYAALHANVQFKLEQLAKLGAYRRPLFVYAHLSVPGSPFVVAADGTFVDPERPFTLRESDWGAGYRERYLEQVRFVESRLLETLDAILRRSRPTPVVIVQSLHGPAASWLEHRRRAGSWEVEDAAILRERLAVLNAVRLPGAERFGFVDDTSLVNTFRIVFNACFGTERELLANQAFWSSYDAPRDVRRIDTTVLRLRPAP